MRVRWATTATLPAGTPKAWLALFEHPSQRLIANVDTKVRVLQAGNLVFPVTVNHTEWENSYVCSPYNAFGPYACFELNQHAESPAVARVLTTLVSGIAAALKRCQINRVVHLNNFLLSTNPYPAWDGAGLAEICACITGEYPQHAIVLRSLNLVQHAPLLVQTLSQYGNCVSASIPLGLAKHWQDCSGQPSTVLLLGTAAGFSLGYVALAFGPTG